MLYACVVRVCECVWTWLRLFIKVYCIVYALQFILKYTHLFVCAGVKVHLQRCTLLLPVRFIKEKKTLMYFCSVCCIWNILANCSLSLFFGLVGNTRFYKPEESSYKQDWSPISWGMYKLVVFPYSSTCSLGKRIMILEETFFFLSSFQPKSMFRSIRSNDITVFCCSLRMSMWILAYCVYAYVHTHLRTYVCVCVFACLCACV